MPKKKLFRVEADTGMALCATADLLGINKDELLENLIKNYVSSVRGNIVEMASKYPAFGDKYPFVESS